MADTGAIQDIGNELKTVYPTGTFEEPVNKVAKFRRDLQRVDLMVSEGGTAKFPLGIASAWNVGIIPDMGTFPAPIDPTRIQGEVSPELFVGSFQIGLKTKAQAKSQKSTFNAGGILADRVENTVSELGKVMNRSYIGSTGLIFSTVESNPGTSTIVLTKPLGAELLNRNMRVDFYNGATPRTAVGRKLTSVNRATRQVVYDGGNDAAIAAGDFVYLAGTYGRTVWTLPQIVGDAADAGTIYANGVRSSYPELNAFVFRGSAGLRDLTEQLILEAIDAPMRETGKKITKAISNSGQARKFVEFVQADRRYAGPQGTAPKYTLGYADDSLQIMAPGVNVTLEVDVDCSPRVMYFLAMDTFGRFEAMALDWIDDDTMMRLVPGSGTFKAGFLAYVGAIENVINTMPRANSRIEDLNDPICGD